MDRAIHELIEFSKPARVESLENGTIVLRGVKYLGAKSANVNDDGSSNVYPLEARRGSEPLYDGAKVFHDHVDRSDRDRDRSIAEQLGRIRGPFDHQEGGSYADLHLNPHHPLSPMIAHDAANNPDSIGLSHHAQGAGVIEGQECRINEIVGVRSVDVVCAGATTRGLFESRQETKMSETETQAAELTLETLRESHADLVKQIEDEAAERVAAETPTESEVIEALQKKVDDLETQRAVEARARKRDQLIAESKIPTEFLGDLFTGLVRNADTDEAAQELIEDRRRLVFHSKPQSGATGPAAEAVKNVSAFLEGKE